MSPVGAAEHLRRGAGFQQIAYGAVRLRIVGGAGGLNVDLRVQRAAQPEPGGEAGQQHEQYDQYGREPSHIKTTSVSVSRLWVL